MQQRWWILAVAVLGIGLAVLLIPRPDTGDIPELPPEEPAPAPVRPPRPDKADLIPGPPPGAEKAIAQRNRPSAKMSRELAAPLGAIRFTLSRLGTDEAKGLADRVGEVQKKFANHISDLEGDLDVIIDEFDPLVAELKSNYGDNTDIAKSVERYEAGVESWNNSAEE
jgi:hypothetical protein